MFVFIDGTEVIKEKLPIFSNNAEYYGTYKGKKVTAIVSTVENLMSSYIKCEVLVDNERAATLTF